MGAYAYLVFTVVFVLFVFINTYLFYKAYKQKHNIAKLTLRWRKDKPDLDLLEGGEPDAIDDIGDKVTAKGKGEAGAADNTNDQTLAAVPEGDSGDESGSDSEQSESEKSETQRPASKKKKKIRDMHGEKARKRIVVKKKEVAAPEAAPVVEDKDLGWRE